MKLYNGLEVCYCIVQRLNNNYWLVRFELERFSSILTAYFISFDEYDKPFPILIPSRVGHKRINNRFIINWLEGIEGKEISSRGQYEVDRTFKFTKPDIMQLLCRDYFIKDILSIYV